MSNKGRVPKDYRYLMDSDIKISAPIVMKQNKKTRNIHGEEEDGFNNTQNQLSKMQGYIPRNLPLEFPKNIKDFVRRDFTDLNKMSLCENCKLIYNIYDEHLEDVTENVMKSVKIILTQPSNHNADFTSVSISYQEFEERVADEINKQLAVIDDLILAYEIKAREETQAEVTKMINEYEKQLYQNKLALTEHDETLATKNEKINNLFNDTAQLLQNNVAKLNYHMAAHFHEQSVNSIKISKLKEQNERQKKYFPSLVAAVIQKRINIKVFGQNIEELQQVKKRNNKLEREIAQLKRELKKMKKGKPLPTEDVSGHNLPQSN